MSKYCYRLHEEDYLDGPFDSVDEALEEGCCQNEEVKIGSEVSVMEVDFSTIKNTEKLIIKDKHIER